MELLENLLDRALKVSRKAIVSGFDAVNCLVNCKSNDNVVSRVKAWAEINQINLLVCDMETYRRLEEIIIKGKGNKRNLFADFFEPLNQPNTVLFLSNLDQAPISLTGWLIRLVDGFNTRKLFNPDKYKGLLFTIGTINTDDSCRHRLDAGLVDRFMIIKE